MDEDRYSHIHGDRHKERKRQRREKGQIYREREKT